MSRWRRGWAVDLAGVLLLLVAIITVVVLLLAVLVAGGCTAAPRPVPQLRRAPPDPEGDREYTRLRASILPASEPASEPQPPDASHCPEGDSSEPGATSRQQATPRQARPR